MIKIEDYIVRYENILDEKTCDSIVQTYDKKNWNRSTVSDSEVNESRKCFGRPLDKKFHEKIFNAIGSILNSYKQTHPFFHTGLTCEDTGYEHLVYLGSEKGEYKMHSDHFDLYPRVLSISFILNDTYDGGDFCFFGDSSLIVKKKKGSAVVFPSNFCFPHAVTPVTNGDRHSIITWIH